MTEAGDDVLLLSKTSLSASSSARTSALKTAVAVLLGCVGGLLFIHLCTRGVLKTPTTDDDVFKVSMQFRGTDDVDIEQHVTSAASSNYVMYHVIKPYETMWIVDDFDRSLQLMKIVTREDRVCYVTHLNRTNSMSPSLYSEQLPGEVAGDRMRVQTTFYADEMQLNDLSQLGSQALKLCIDTPTFWVYPLANKASSVDTEPDTHSRQKRNVKKCMTSCCTLVCCCNQRYLQWQTYQKINCHNVCHGCTPQSKMFTHEVC